MVVAVPSWNARGVIDPNNPLSPTDANRSPYAVSLTAFVEAFATSVARATILQGYLRYRAELHTAGLVKGFQWLDGSFLENIEVNEMRDPGDIDVVTFYEMPAAQSQASLRANYPGLFPVNGVEHEALKKRLCVDAYYQQLDGNKPTLTAAASRLVNWSAYWYSMWSHRRDLSWKGFMQVDLSGAEDAQAWTKLSAAIASMASAPGAAPLAPATGAVALAGPTPTLAAPVAATAVMSSAMKATP